MITAAAILVSALLIGLLLGSDAGKPTGDRPKQIDFVYPNSLVPIKCVRIVKHADY